MWETIQAGQGTQYHWELESTYIQRPPYFDEFNRHIPCREELQKMRPLAIFGDSVTTDHISPAGAFNASSSAGAYLLSLGISEKEFNSYGSRRGNHQVMIRGTFANVRIRNRMMAGKEGGFTKLMPEGIQTTIFDASEEYKKRHPQDEVVVKDLYYDGVPILDGCYFSAMHKAMASSMPGSMSRITFLATGSSYLEPS